VALARSLTDAKMKYDFDFRHQKGAESGQWVCVGFTEKLYESANTTNPGDLNTLVYNPNEYAVDITPDGFDNYSTYNSSGDCFATTKEFSKIARRPNLLLPAPEIIGYNAGVENGLDHYLFLPMTQFLQGTLEDVAVDINLESDFEDEEIRGRTPQVALIFKWSLINNPSSSLRQIATIVKDKISTLFKKPTALAVSVSDGNKSTSVKKPVATTKAKITKAITAKTTKSKATKAVKTKVGSVVKTVASKTTPTAKISTSSTKVLAKTTASIKKPVVSIPKTARPVTKPVVTPLL